MKISLSKLNQILLFISYFIYLSFSLLARVTFLGSFLKLCTNIAVFLLIFSIILQFRKYKKTDLLIFMFLFCLSFLLIWKNHDSNFFKFSLFLMAMKNVEFKKCVRFDFFLRLFLISLVLLFYILGYTPDVISYFEGKIRRSLGFTNPNSLGMHFLILCFDMIYLKQFKISHLQIILMILLLLFVDYFSGSRTADLVLVVMIILCLIYKYKPNFFEKYWVKKIMCNSFLIFSLLTLLGVFTFNKGSTLGRELNLLLSNRLKNIQIYQNFYKISLFGNDITNAGLTIDNTFAYLLYGLGIISYVFFLIMFKKLLTKILKQKDYLLLIIMTCFTFYGLSERLWFFVDYNIFMLSFSILFQVSSGIEKKEINVQDKN